MVRSTLRTTATAIAVTLTTALATGASIGTAGPAGAAPYATGAAPIRATAAATDDGAGQARGDYDARRGSGSRARATNFRRAAEATARPATAALKRRLGPQALLDIDGTTGTPRLVADLDGYLTGPSRRSPARIALGYVTRHHAALGLTTADLRTFRLHRDYRDINGTHHLSWRQSVGGEQVYGNGLTASVTRQGRLLTLGGSPVSGADPVATGGARQLATGPAAIRAARRDVGDRSATPGAADSARRVLFVTPGGSYLGWQTVTMSAEHPALSVLDARSGRVLFRRSLSDDANAPDPHSRGTAFPYFPKAPRGGRQVPVDYTRRGWLAPRATELSGNNSHAYSDVNDDNLAESSEEVPPRVPYRWDYPLVPFHLAGVSFCDNPYPCSWDPSTPYSWQTNRAQNTAQVFYFVNRWHDHLEARPIGFTEAAGNFQLHNRTAAGVAGDPVTTETEDGADTDNGLPDSGHIDNANMDTPPDGDSPRMQMYLQHQPGTSYPDGDPFAPTDVGDEADTVYHEYTHGLSNRLVVDVSGNSTLGSVQAGAMGEAWSDWYAMDDLVATGLQTDRKGTVDVVLFQYDGAGVALDRTEPIDCKVGSTSARCTGGETGHTGGYTYADYGHVVGFPEVHGDGEIWSQTLWDLRDALGSRTTESLVTRAMELSPTNPSFLDERNAILLADTAAYGGRHHATIWRVFAHRGMGYRAGALDGNDSTPGADATLPPRQVRRAFVTGTVTDADTHQPLAGAPVTIAFQGGGPVNPTATTDADGHYRLGPVPVGHYAKIIAGRGGYDVVASSVTVTRAGAVKSFATRRDWGASSGGATVTAFDGPDYSPACGPAQAIDGSLSTGWGSTTGDDDGTPTGTFVPKHLTIQLPTSVDIRTVAIDPSATCGDDPSSSLGDYTLETSGDGTTWTTAATGAFGSADDGRLNPVTPTAGATAVRFVRLTMRGNQTPDFATSCPGGGASGCSYTDLSELEVYGTPAG